MRLVAGCVTEGKLSCAGGRFWLLGERLELPELRQLRTRLLMIRTAHEPPIDQDHVTSRTAQTRLSGTDVNPSKDKK
jgi:hypothetical protein